MPKIAVKSKTIQKGEAYKSKLTKKSKKKSLKSKDLLSAKKEKVQQSLKAKKLSKKQKKKLSKSLWESTQIIDPKDIPELSDDDDGEESMSGSD